MELIDGEQVWAWHATYGFPLEMSLTILAERGFVPTWDRLLESAKKDGTNLPRLIDRIIAAAYDAYGEDVGGIISVKLPKLLARLN